RKSSLCRCGRLPQLVDLPRKRQTTTKHLSPEKQGEERSENHSICTMIHTVRFQYNHAQSPYAQATKIDSAKPSQMIRARDVSEADPTPRSLANVPARRRPGMMGDQGKLQKRVPLAMCDAWAELVGLGAQYRRGGNGHQGIRVGQFSWVSIVHPRPGQRQWDLESIGLLWCGIRVGQDFGAQGSAIMRQKSVSAILSGGWANSSSIFAVVDGVHAPRSIALFHVPGSEIR
ncbi:hypothetical protein C8J57DRAFT_1634413, partial [Mycena rebaudengoi]